MLVSAASNLSIPATSTAPSISVTPGSDEDGIKYPSDIINNPIWLGVARALKIDAKITLKNTDKDLREWYHM